LRYASGYHGYKLGLTAVITELNSVVVFDAVGFCIFRIDFYVVGGNGTNVFYIVEGAIDPLWNT
jgi:hypothetical protein